PDSALLALPTAPVVTVEELLLGHGRPECASCNECPRHRGQSKPPSLHLSTLFTHRTASTERWRCCIKPLGTLFYTMASTGKQDIRGSAVLVESVRVDGRPPPASHRLDHQHHRKPDAAHPPAAILIPRAS